MTDDPIWTRPAEQDPRRIARDQAARVIDAVDRLAATGSGDVRPLQGRDRQWRLRVGDIRVIFTNDDETNAIRVIGVLPWSRAYRA